MRRRSMYPGSSLALRKCPTIPMVLRALSTPRTLWGSFGVIEIDILEKTIRSVGNGARSIKDLKPYEIKTIMLKRSL